MSNENKPKTSAKKKSAQKLKQYITIRCKECGSEIKIPYDYAIRNILSVSEDDCLDEHVVKILSEEESKFICGSAKYAGYVFSGYILQLAIYLDYCPICNTDDEKKYSVSGFKKKDMKIYTGLLISKTYIDNFIKKHKLDKYFNELHNCKYSKMDLYKQVMNPFWYCNKMKIIREYNSIFTYNDDELELAEVMSLKNPK